MEADAVTLALVGARGDRPRARERTDAALVRAGLAGEDAAFTALFHRHWPRAHQAAWLITHDAQAAEDVAQEAFQAVFGRLDRFDRRRPFGPWLHRIVVNRAIDFTRARAARHELAGEPPPGDDARNGDGGAAEGPDVLAALAGLGPEHRAVVVLRHLLGYSPGEIARLLEIPRGTVNSRLRRALDVLADRLEAGA